MPIHIRIIFGVCALAAAMCGWQGAEAQGWGGWGGYGRDYEQPPAPGPQGYSRGYEQPPVYGQQGERPGSGSPNPRCHDLESQLTGGASNIAGQDQLARIEADMRQADAQYHRAEADAEHANCYEDMFLFGRSLRRTPRCVDLDHQVQSAKSALAQLKVQRDAALRSSSPRGRHDDLIAELARNRCGDQYVREHDAQRGRSGSIFSFFSDEEPEDTNRFNATTTTTIPTYGASGYRTLCVRECDGFYFPISTATTENQFRNDDAKCRSQCAAPAELYYHRSDQDVDQMVSLTGRPYSEMPNAFRNRKVFIRGCSCNATEYSREEIAKSEEALKNAKRADAGGGKAAADAAFARRISQAVQRAPAQAAPATPPAPNPSAPAEAPQPPATGH